MKTPAGACREVLSRRIMSVSYLLNVYGGKVCWLNSVHISRHDFDSALWNKIQQQAPIDSSVIFCLGYSISLLNLDSDESVTPCLVNLSTVLKEYEAFVGATGPLPKAKLLSGVGKRILRSLEVKRPLGSSASSVLANGNSATNTNTNNAQPSLSVVGVAQGHFHYFHLPFHPDAYETFVTLCETLLSLLRRLETLCLDSPEISMDTAELLYKVDERLRKLIVEPTIRDIEALGKSLTYEETAKLERLLLQAH